MRITVYAGSSAGTAPVYREAATALGTAAAESGHDLVYGGGAPGLMGAVADAALAAGGTVTGVMPRSLVDAEVAHTGLTTLHVVQTMHERKQMMADLGDAFIALPGGVGTAEEILEAWAWLVLGHHAKPVALLNVAGYWSPLESMARRMHDEGFNREAERGSLLIASTFNEFLTALTTWKAPPKRWVPTTV